METTIKPLWYECQVTLPRAVLVDVEALARADLLGFYPTYFSNFMGTVVKLHFTHPDFGFLQERLKALKEEIKWERCEVKAVLEDKLAA